MALSAMQTRRRQLVEMLTAEKNRLGSAPRWSKPSVQDHIAWLEQSLKKTDDDLDKAIRLSPAWRVKDNIYQSIPGVGRVLSCTLMTQMPELGTLDGKQIALLAGLAPLNRDSGKRSGNRSIWGGRGEFRAVLYMATLSALQHNPVIRKFYNRLI